MATPTCFDVANYFLSLSDEDSGDYISNLKLQKLVYYAQGIHLSMHGQPLFDEEIEAWTHGPVIPDLYRQYKEHHDMAIPKPDEIDLSKYPPNVRELLDDVYTTLGQYSAWKLRTMTHDEIPWRNAYEKGQGTPISREEMGSYFKSFLKSA